MFKSTYYFLRDIIGKRSSIFELVRRDLQQQYTGSYLGAVWIFLQPLLFILVIYSVFTLGLRVGQSEEMPFSIYLVTGMVAWLHFSVNFNSNTNIIRSYGFLLKRVDFRLSVLPIVQMLSSLVVHAFLVLFAIMLAWYEGISPSLYTLQIIYYLFALSALLLGLGWLTSSLSVFIKDIVKLVAVLVQFGFWLTPIFWNIEMLPEEYRWIIKFNPVYYIVSGYRESIVGQVPFWQKEGTVLYWVITIFIMYIGITVYRKLRPHFAEVI
jgi:lipopolysaccharide transport system permease protein/teichoic acid transport system permease protein